MSNLGLIFITGLTTGGLSCLAVQGGLLADVVAREAEVKITNNFRAREVKSIGLFLSAKIIAYTLLGFLLGKLGTLLQLTPYMRATLMAVIAIFMVGTALRMLRVHPIFNYFVLQPPKVVTKFMRRFAKNNHDAATPLFLGSLTVLIPCGVTQAMMMLAVGTGRPLEGAAIMFSFTLGTSPVFFALAYLATRLGEKMHRHFLRVAALAIFVLGLITFNSSLNLFGSSLSLSSLRQNRARASLDIPIVTPTALPASSGLTDKDPAKSVTPAPSPITSQTASSTISNKLIINVVNNGYSPSTLYAKANQPINLKLVTDNTGSCSRAFTIPTLGIQKILPESGTVALDLPAQDPRVIRFTCSMGMYNGQIIIQE